jgi:mediator of RNA polymerase II transcription subunit 18
VRHVGGAMRGAGAEQLPALVRPVLEAGISSNALRFMYALGYKLDYELLRTGFSFQMRKTVPTSVVITITVTAVHKLPKMHAVDDAVAVSPGFHMVQLTAPASPDNYSDIVGAISSFAEFLAP